MKLRYIIALFIAGLITAMSLDTQALGQNSSVNTVDKWRYTGGYVQLASSTAKLSIPGLASSDECIKTDSAGKTYTGTCGTGSGSLSGGSANTLTYWESSTGVAATSSPTVGYITATTTSTSSFGGPVTIAKDLEVSVVGSSQAVPRTFGLSALSSGNAARFQFGDYHNALQNAYAQDMNLYSYWALVLTGGRQNFSSGFYPMPFTKYTDVGVLVKSDSYISNDPTGASTTIDTLGIMATTSQWTNLTSWRNPSGTTMSLVDYLGHFSLGTNATSSSVLNVNGLTTLTNASTTHMSVSGNSYLGTVNSGTWNGASLADAYVDDNITASSYLSLASWFATTTIPHLVSFGSTSATTTALGNLTITGNAFKGSVPLLASGGTLSTNYVCRWDGTGIDCDRVEDASGACGANAVCMGGHTHVGVNETYGSGWNGDTDTPEKDDVYDYAHLFDTDDDGKVDVLDMTFGVVGVSSTGVVSATTSPTFNFIIATSTTASSTFQAITGTAFGIVGKWFADATRFIVQVAAQFTAGLTVLDFLDIPSSTNPTVDAEGEIAINTTAASSSLRYYDGTAERVLSPIVERSFSFASSTLDYMGDFGAAGTTTILLMNSDRPITLTDIYCKTNTGTTSIQFSDGTNKADEIRCGPNGAEDDGTIANSTWTRREDFKIEIGSSVGTPGNITVTAGIRNDAD